jgi:hypothetical protein
MPWAWRVQALGAQLGGLATAFQVRTASAGHAGAFYPALPDRASRNGSVGGNAVASAAGVADFNGTLFWERWWWWTVRGNCES